MPDVVIHLFGGSLQVTLRAEDQQDLIRQAAFYSQLPHRCPICDSPIHFQYRTPQDYEFFGLECSGAPRHETTLGVYKGAKGLFYKGAGSWRKAGQPDAEDSGSPPPVETPAQPARPRPPTLDPKRAADMHRELGKLGLASAQHLQVATVVLGRPIESLTAITETEAGRVWTYARRQAELKEGDQQGKPSRPQARGLGNGRIREDEAASFTQAVGR